MRIKKGFFLIYRIYDVASEIDLNGISKTFDLKRIELSRKYGIKLAYFRNPPILVFIEQCLYNNLNCDVFAKFYEFGAISIIFKIYINDFDINQVFRDFHEILNSENIDNISQNYLKLVFEQYKSFFKKPFFYGDYEDYAIIYILQFDKNLKSRDIISQIDIPKLLLGEKYNLSRQLRDSILKNKFSYSDEDLVVLNWDTAFVYEPDGIMDIPDLIEFANAQLLEFRYYDSYLDSVLDETYSAIEKFKGSFFEYAKYQKVLKKLLLLYNEITESKEMVVNSLKIFEDSYFARVYSKMLEILGVYSWQRSIESKERTLFEIYNFLNDQISNRRLELLEIIIILVIVLDILLFFIVKR